MEIHSSSLATIPAGYKARHKNDETRLVNIVEKNIDSDKIDSHRQSVPNTENDTTKTKELQRLTDRINQQQNRPMNSRTSRAINSYVQENIKPLKNDRSELISGIDLFV